MISNQISFVTIFFVFLTVVITIFGWIAFLFCRDWATYRRLNPKEVQRILTQVSKLIILEEWQLAKKALSRLIKYGGERKEIAFAHLQVLRGTHQLESALLLAQHSSRLYPEELYFRVEEGKILLELGRGEEALAAFRVAAPIIRQERDLLDMARAYLQSNLPKEALEILEPLLPSSPHGYVHALLAEALSLQKEFAKSISYYVQAIQKGVNNHLVQTKLGMAYREVGKTWEAEKIFRAILEKDSSDVGATLGLGGCMQDRGHYRKALLIYQSGEAWKKRDLSLLFQAGACALYSGRFSLAETYFKEVYQREKPTLALLSYYGFALEQQQKWEEAEEIYLQQIQCFPSKSQGYRALAWLFGVGLSSKITKAEGLGYANRALMLVDDLLSWEILSACEARAGHFERAYQIQEHLATLDKEREEKKRRQHLLRTLRKELPLGDHDIVRELVA